MTYASDPDDRADLAADLVSGEATVDELTEYDDVTFVNNLLQPAYERGHFDEREEVVYVDRTAVENYGIEAVQEVEHQQVHDAWRNAVVSDSKQKIYETAKTVATAPYHAGRKTADAITTRVGREKQVERVGSSLVTPSQVAGLAGVAGVGASWLTGSPELAWGSLGVYFTAKGGRQFGDGLAEEAEQQASEEMLDTITDTIGGYTVKAVRMPSAQPGT